MTICVIELLLMAIAALCDFRKKEISLWLIIAMAAVSFVGAIIGIKTGEKNIGDIMLSLLPGLCMLLFSRIFKHSMGYGDGLIMLSVAMAFGTCRTLTGLIVAIYLSGIISIILLVVKRAKRQDTFPFVPFLFTGMVVSMFA